MHVSTAKQDVSVREPVKERSYAIVKPKDENVKITSEQVKKCVMKKSVGS